MTVQQPADVTVSTADGSVRLIWNKDFAIRWGTRFLKSQIATGRAVLRMCEPYIPLKTGRLIASGSVDDEGNVSWHAPYARYQYFRPRKVGTAKGLRGPFWFHRMKEANKDRIVKVAKEAIAE